MACEDLKTKADALEASVKNLQAEIAKEPKPEQAASEAALRKLSAEAFAAQQAYAECVAANMPPAPPPKPLVAPEQILEIQNVMAADFVARAKTALQSLLNSIGQNTFPVHEGSEWIQPLAPTTEYDEEIVGVTGWAVNPRVVGGDFPFSHPFQNSINSTPFDFEFSLAMDRPAANPTEFDFLLTAGNKAPSNGSSTDERVQDEGFARQLGLNFPTGLLGVEMDSANIPRGFINGVHSGDRVAVFGRWIVDTGHSLATQSGTNVPRTEIHPPLLVAAASNPAPDTTRVLITSRAFLTGDTYTTDQKTIYDDTAGNDGTFFVHLIKEVIKANANILGIPTESLLVEAHPKIKSYPFRGVNLMHLVVRPPAQATHLGQTLQPQHIEVSFNFTVRTSCAVEVTSSAANTVDIYIVMNQAGYKQFPLPANKGRRWSRSELAALNSSSGSDYLDAEIVSAALQVLGLGGPIGAVVVDSILARGIQSDAYASLNDLVDISSTHGAVNNVSPGSIPQNAGVTHNDAQPYPVYGWLEVKWVNTIGTVQEGKAAATVEQLQAP